MSVHSGLESLLFCYVYEFSAFPKLSQTAAQCLKERGERAFQKNLMLFELRHSRPMVDLCNPTENSLTEIRLVDSSVDCLSFMQVNKKLLAMDITVFSVCVYFTI